MQLRNILLAVAGVLFVILIYVYFFTGPPSLGDPDELAAAALTAADAAERDEAATTLALIGEDAIEQMRRVMNETQDDSVKAIVIGGLGRVQDWESMESFFKALESDNAIVRGRAARAIERVMGVRYGYEAKANASERQQIVAQMREYYQRRLENPRPAVDDTGADGPGDP